MGHALLTSAKEFVQSAKMPTILVKLDAGGISDCMAEVSVVHDEFILFRFQ